MAIHKANAVPTPRGSGMTRFRVSRPGVHGKPYTQIEKLLMSAGMIDGCGAGNANALA
jgi:hypothetical protein